MWLSIALNEPPVGKLVWTAIIDENGTRNVQQLQHKNGLWFGSDGYYVYYVPTHWSY